MLDLSPVFHVPTALAAIITTLVLVNTPRAMSWVGRSLSRIGKKTA